MFVSLSFGVCSAKQYTYLLNLFFCFQAQTLDAQSPCSACHQARIHGWNILAKCFLFFFPGHQGDGRQAALSARLWSLSMSDQRCGLMAQLQSWHPLYSLVAAGSCGLHGSAMGMGTEVISLGEDTFAFCVGKVLRFAVGYFFLSAFCYNQLLSFLLLLLQELLLLYLLSYCYCYNHCCCYSYCYCYSCCFRIRHV